MEHLTPYLSLTRCTRYSRWRQDTAVGARYDRWRQDTIGGSKKNPLGTRYDRLYSSKDTTGSITITVNIQSLGTRYVEVSPAGGRTTNRPTHLHEKGLELAEVSHLLLTAPTLLRTQCRHRAGHPRICRVVETFKVRKYVRFDGGEARVTSMG